MRRPTTMSMPRAMIKVETIVDENDSGRDDDHSDRHDDVDENDSDRDHDPRKGRSHPLRAVEHKLWLRMCLAGFGADWERGTCQRQQFALFRAAILHIISRMLNARWSIPRKRRDTHLF